MRLPHLPPEWADRVAGLPKPKKKLPPPDKAAAFFFTLQAYAPAELPHWVAEHRFFTPRRWRFDAADLEAKVAVEIDGGAYVRGRHSRAAGIESDNEKINTAITDGWVVFRFTPQQLAREPEKCLGQVLAVARGRR